MSATSLAIANEMFLAAKQRVENSNVLCVTTVDNHLLVSSSQYSQ